MISRIALCFAFIFSVTTQASGQNAESAGIPTDYVQAFKDTVTSLAGRTDNLYFKKHFLSMIDIIEARYNSTEADTIIVTNLYHAFNNATDPANPKQASTYFERKRPLIVAWVSPTDGNVSFSWLTLPKNWDPSKKYPMYIQLHGAWPVAYSGIEYMAWPYIEAPSTSIAYEDGYFLSPWARGNYWYIDISETDIYECMAFAESTFNIDQSRKFITGHSMGGYGAWSIASQTPNEWAGVGIYAGALNYASPYLLNLATAELLKDVPVYFVCGTNDYFLEMNERAYGYLSTVGNKNILFTYFDGGHEYTDENVTRMYMWFRSRITTSLVPGIPENMDIACYPNPASSAVRIQYSLPRPLTSEIAVYDNSGRIVRQFINDRMAEGSLSLNAEDLAPGLYFIMLKSSAGSSQTKLIINR